MFWSQTRKNHGLEHATISLLLQSGFQGSYVAGYSIPSGFFILGNLPTANVANSASEALKRLNNGESSLAISPFCGTNIVVTAALTTLITIIAYHANSKLAGKLTQSLIGAIWATVLAKPLGRFIQQRYTTSADLAEIQIGKIVMSRIGNVTIHWVPTYLQKPKHNPK